MLNENDENETEGGLTVSSKLFGLLIAGFVLIFVGVIIVFAASLVFGGGSGSVGGVVFIGPIPIVFGAGPDAGWLILIGVVLAVLSLFFFYVFYRRRGKIEE